nr:hypothetical protein [Conexibacter arvalis]
MPAGLVAVRSTPRARLAGGRHCWTVRALGPRASRGFQLVVRALSGASGRKTNTAVATSADAVTARARRTVVVAAGGHRAGGVTG